MLILDAVEASLADFRPKTHRQFVVFNIATRFNDVANLARYLNIAPRHPKRVLMEAARLAESKGGAPDQVVGAFFALLTSWEGKEAVP
jgi:hypothetical protein